MTLWFLLSLAGDRSRQRGEEGGRTVFLDEPEAGLKAGKQGRREYSDLSGTAQGNAIPNTAECYKPPP